jgi:microcystin-dependent protein
MWATDTPPTGYLECDGSAVSRTTYAALFSAIGTTFGSGDGSTTFNLPDIRGQFVRGWDDGAGIDTGRTFGSTQAPTGIASANTASNSNGAQVNTDGAAVTGGGYSIWNGSPFTSSSSYFTTRPTNIALMFCIKY